MRTICPVAAMIPTTSTRIPAALSVIAAILVGCHSSRAPTTKPGVDQHAEGKQSPQSTSSTKLGAGGQDANWPSVAVVQYRAFQQTHSAEEEAAAIGYDKSQGAVLKLRRLSGASVAAYPGKSISFEMEYAVLGPKNGLEIAEEWEILKDGKRLTSTSPRIESRHPGGWRVSVSLGLPRGAKPGVYVVRGRVHAGQLADSRDSSFTVTRMETSQAPKTKSAGEVDTVDRDLMEVQARLKELGHDPGPIDGRARPQTQAALMAFQKDYGLAATGEVDAQTLAALNLGKPNETRLCEKAQGTVKDYLRNPAEPSGQGSVIEVCDTGTDYRLNGAIVVAKNANHPTFAENALDDLSNIASISDPSGHVGFDFLVRLLETLSKSRLPVAERAVYVRWGGAPRKSKPDKLTPVTHPGTSGGSPANAEWQAATAQGLDVYSDDGTPAGGASQYFKGLSKGTGSGIGASVFYQPEILPDPTICASGMTPDIALLHELQHAARMASGEVDNTPYSNSWWNKDPLAAQYGVHEEKFIVERENEYRNALKEKYPSRHPNLRPRQSYLGDC